MYGAILGDMIGAPYEFDRGNVKRRIVFGRDDELIAGITHRQKPVKDKPLRGAFSVLDKFLAMS